jgi:hypothetical protein
VPEAAGKIDAGEADSPCLSFRRRGHRLQALERVNARLPEGFFGHTAVMETGAPLRVIYVAGISHNGSTLLGRMLGELDGTFYGGELLRLS